MNLNKFFNPSFCNLTMCSRWQALHIHFPGAQVQYVCILLFDWVHFALFTPFQVNYWYHDFAFVIQFLPSHLLACFRGSGRLCWFLPTSPFHYWTSCCQFIPKQVYCGSLNILELLHLFKKMSHHQVWVDFRQYQHNMFSKHKIHAIS